MVDEEEDLHSIPGLGGGMINFYDSEVALRWHSSAVALDLIRLRS